MIVFCRAPTPSDRSGCISDLKSDNLDTIQITHEGSNSLPDFAHLSDADRRNVERSTHAKAFCGV
jgi:hypothetical protein